MLSIIIPTLNEASQLPLLFADIKRFIGDYEVTIVDGGSNDLTHFLINISGFKIIKSIEANRGIQLNKGAENSKGDWFLFLHADSRLDINWAKKVMNIMNKSKSKRYGWYFDFKVNNKKLSFRLLEKIVLLRNLFFQTPYGDQGLLIHKDLYNLSGGFSDLKIMEDLDLITRITKKNKAKRIGENIYTDDIRWVKSNIIKRAIHNARLRKKWRQGYDIDKLSKEYYS